MIIKVLIFHKFRKLRKEFDYQSDIDDLKIGSLVLVDFNGKQIQGLVTKINVKEQIDIIYKKVIKKINNPFFENSNMLELIKEYARENFQEYIDFLINISPKYFEKEKQKPLVLDYLKIINNDSLSSKNKNINKFLNSVLTGNEILKSDAAKKYNLKKGHFDKLLSLKKIKIIKKEKTYDYNKNNSKEFKYKLNSDQKNAIKEIEKNIDKKPILLQGKTGSGKTLIYASLIKKELKQNKKVIIIVPEKVIAFNIEDKLNMIFPKQCVIMHSSINNNERRKNYYDFINGDKKILIGTRPNIFIDDKYISLIIIDEAHSYSLVDSKVYYDVNDFAYKRFDKNKTKVIYGSATPSFKLNFAAENQKIKKVSLNKSFYNKELKIIKYSNLNTENLLNEKTLINLKENYENGKQSILIFNRKGYYSNVYCLNCGHVEKCPNCEVSLVYYKNKEMKCHYCDYKRKITKCTNCNENNFRFNKKGIESLYEELTNNFKNQDIAIIDGNIKSRIKINKILNNFKQNKIKILIGTEIISKGIDFLDVSLVILVNVDDYLNLPFYFNNEKTYQFINQSIGRNRLKNKAIFIIQTNNQDNYVINNALESNYDEFYKKEIILRRKQKKPPFFKEITISFSYYEFNLLFKYTNKVRNYIMENDFNVSSLLTPFIAKRDKNHILELKIYDRNNTFLNFYENDLKNRLQKQEKITINFYIDKQN